MGNIGLPTTHVEEIVGVFSIMERSAKNRWNPNTYREPIISTRCRKIQSKSLVFLGIKIYA